MRQGLDAARADALVDEETGGDEHHPDGEQRQQYGGADEQRVVQLGGFREARNHHVLRPVPEWPPGVEKEDARRTLASGRRGFTPGPGGCLPALPSSPKASW